MTEVENCVVRRSLKSLNLKQRQKLLATVCLTFQETVEGNSHRSAVGKPENFVHWGKRWGTNRTEDRSAAHYAKSLGQPATPPYGDNGCDGSMVPVIFIFMCGGKRRSNSPTKR